MRVNPIVIFLLLFTVCTKSTAQSNTSALVPMPNNIITYDNSKTFKFNKNTSIKSNIEEADFLSETLTHIIENRTGLKLVQNNNAKNNVIEFNIDTTFQSPEHYTLEVNKRGIFIKGATEGAVFMAFQTLDQILLGDICKTSNNEIEFITIDDTPRYSYRAIMLDPARHFLPVADIKFFIDQMARFKFNTLQLHLTDDQGWRIEIKSHPRLTEKGAFRTADRRFGPDNGYYTQEDIKEIIEYAAKRNIEVIPELDIPGHSVAILAAYPELGCTFRHNEEKKLGTTTNMMLCAANEKVYRIYDDIIREVAALFPSNKIHLGGDEAAVKENWAKCSDCQNMMKKLGYNTPSQLMTPFFDKILASVRKYGKKAVLWCELDNIWPPANDYLFPYPQNVTLVTWRNALTPKCIELTHRYGHQLIMAPGEHTYLDYPQYPGDLPEFNNWGMPVTTLQQSYALDPGYGLKPEEQSHIQGVMATLWAEAIRDINRVTYMTFPRGMAIAEAGWSEMPQRNWESFKKRIYPNISDMMKDGVSIRVPFEIVERK